MWLSTCARLREKSTPEQPPGPEPIMVNRNPKQVRGKSGGWLNVIDNLDDWLPHFRGWARCPVSD
jgi:hypothetical protein